MQAGNSRSRTHSPTDLFPQKASPLLVLGDLNIHHPLADPLRDISAPELLLSSPYFSRASSLGFSLLNSPGEYTRFPFKGTSRPSVIDLSFANPALAPFFESWSLPYPSTGSDHVPIRIVLSAPITRGCPAPTPNWSCTDWASVLPLVSSLTIPPPPVFPSPASLDAWFDASTNRLTHILTSHTPMKRPSIHSKPWWTPVLTALRKSFHRAAQSSRNNVQSSLLEDEERKARSLYHREIRKAKNRHWSQFLGGVDKGSIWTARRVAAGW